MTRETGYATPVGTLIRLRRAGEPIEYVVSFDRGFDDVPGLTRIEPD
ncbi:MAG: hypothetical protein AB1758_30495 [Candidatus Eremiobacterota bacterium]